RRRSRRSTEKRRANVRELKMIGALVVMVVLVMGAAGCAMMGQDKPAEPSLYKRLGGREGIALVVGDFVSAMAADPRVNARFKDMKPEAVEKFKSYLADQICEAAGGPCSYLGSDMKTVHKGMNVSEAEW